MNHGSLTHPFTHPPIHSPTLSLTHPFTHPFTHPPIHSPTHSPTHPFTHPPFHSPTHSLINPFTHHPIHSPTHSGDRLPNKEPYENWKSGMPESSIDLDGIHLHGPANSLLLQTQADHTLGILPARSEFYPIDKLEFCLFVVVIII